MESQNSGGYNLPGYSRVTDSKDYGPIRGSVVPRIGQETDHSDNIPEIEYGEDADGNSIVISRKDGKQNESKLKKTMSAARRKNEDASFPIVQSPAIKNGFKIMIDTELGSLSAEAYDVSVNERDGLLAISYHKLLSGNRFIPKASEAVVSLLFSDLETQESTEYNVSPLGLSFTIKQAQLEVVLLQIVKDPE